MKTPSRVTLSDVAAAAGVSLATASRALNGSERTVTPELVTQVRAAADRLGYVVDARAQEMARGLSAGVGLVLGDIADPYFAGIASGVIAAAAERGLVVTMSAISASGRSEREIVGLLRSQRPRAIVLANSRPREGLDDDGVAADLAAYRSAGGGTAIIADVEGRPSGTVAVDNAASARALAVALAGIGYSSFAVLGGAPDLDTPHRRATGFLAGLADAGVAPPEGGVRYGEFTRDGGYAAMAELLDAGARPECVFAVTDMMAVGAMAAIRSRGLRPGADIGVAGFDDITMLQDVSPSLSTVRLPLHLLGRVALETALTEADAPGGSVAAEVILRESTPPR